MPSNKMPEIPKHGFPDGKAFQDAYDDGFNEGRDRGYRDVLDLLQKWYMDPKNKRQSPEARSILVIAQRLSNEVKSMRMRVRGFQG